jgi:hypothetical protein
MQHLEVSSAVQHIYDIRRHAGIKSFRATLPDEIFLLGILLLEPCISLIYA